ncbi:MAG TPA: sigma-54 dependent transcriptional regulator [Bryobacteraceae bacterium]|nr:sigma-54 dependent transcriptional regulator [Bryobacteraceae bacterium]
MNLFNGEPELLVASGAMREVVRLIEKAARLDAAILITGETGTGKELVARAAHRFSARQGAWVDCNCAAFPEHLIESELFGFEAGAFSGAMRAKAGLFELAAGGSLFLDEVGEVPLNIQAKLLRVLDGAPYLRLGGVRRITPMARIIAATNRSLEREAETGRFRPDLFYRLNQVHIHIPPLRERRADILVLAEAFLAKLNPDLRIDGRAASALEAYDWPGNARELRGVLMAASLLVEDGIIRMEHLGERLTSGKQIGSMTLAAVERQMIVTALEEAKGNRSRAASRVGISRRTLNRRLQEYGLDEPGWGDQRLSA